MKTRIFMMVLLMAVAAMVVVPMGCEKKAPQGVSEAPEQELCAGCGQVKGSDLCCVEGAEKCAKCGLDKGSPGCCKPKAQ
jgi:hypothetical protein